MKFTLGWLREHLDTEASLEEIAERLPMIGLEVEAVEDRAGGLAAFVVGLVTEARPHPNADRLRLCRVDVGGETHEVVCGAPNARAGMKGVFAGEGAWIPGTGTRLARTTIRGVESAGMLCSERELGVSDDHDSIVELPAAAEIGGPAAEAMGLGDPVIEIALTPNRADCAAVRGVARDLAAAGLGALRPLDAAPVAGRFASPLRWRRDFAPAAADACPLVVGRYFRNVRNGPSPKWLQDRLTAVGLRPISALVDVTNFVTLDLARPLHVFDADKIAGDPVMRLARDGERLAALDGKTYELDRETTVIADDRDVLAIGGVMGGEPSGCSAATTNVFLEVALFDPVRTAAAGRKLGIASDARYRFERGVDPTSAQWGAEVAARLILDVCGGEASEPVSAGETPGWERRVTLRHSRIASLSGARISRDEAEATLNRLGFAAVANGDDVSASVPPWRPDVDGEADLVEEVLRIRGFDRIPAVPLPRAESVPRPALDAAQRRTGRVRRALAARGLVEAITFSFLSGERARPFGDGDGDDADGDGMARLSNPISADLDAMRPSLLPNLVDAAGRNDARGVGDAALFEVGPQFADATPEGQSLAAAGVRAGAAAPRHWDARPRQADAFDAKADALAALAAAGAPAAGLRTSAGAPGRYHPGRSGTLRLGADALGHFGELHPALLRRLDVRAPVAAFEVFLDRVPLRRERRASGGKALDLPTLQPVSRDFAFLVADDVQADAVVRAARSADRELIVDVSVFDVYRGAGLPDGEKSVAVAVTLQPRRATLTDGEIDAVSGRIAAAVGKATGGALRGREAAGVVR